MEFVMMIVGAVIAVVGVFLGAGIVLAGISVTKKQ